MPIVFVFGDFNGRTKDLPDFIQHDELHEAVLEIFQHTMKILYYRQEQAQTRE